MGLEIYSSDQSIIVVIEYNAVLGDLFPITIPYAASFMRTRYHYSNLYFGASLPALISSVSKKAIHSLVNNTGVIFVGSDYSSIFTSGLIRNIASYPLFREFAWAASSYGLQRSEIIGDCPSKIQLLVKLQRSILWIIFIVRNGLLVIDLFFVILSGIAIS